MKKIFFVVVAALLLAGAGCGLGGKISNDNKGKNVKVSTDQGTMEFGSGNKLPEDWPKDAPTYQGATVQFSGSVPVDGKTALSVILQTNDSAQKVLDFYKKELADKEWKIAGSFQDKEIASLNAQKDDRFFTVMIIASQGFTSITATVGSK